MYGYNKEKLRVNHFWELKDLSLKFLRLLSLQYFQQQSTCTDFFLLPVLEWHELVELRAKLSLLFKLPSIILIITLWRQQWLKEVKILKQHIRNIHIAPFESGGITAKRSAIWIAWSSWQWNIHNLIFQVNWKSTPT